MTAKPQHTNQRDSHPNSAQQFQFFFRDRNVRAHVDSRSRIDLMWYDSGRKCGIRRMPVLWIIVTLSKMEKNRPTGMYCLLVFCYSKKTV